MLERNLRRIILVKRLMGNWLLKNTSFFIHVSIKIAFSNSILLEFSK